MRVLLSGYYGFGNLGDEAILAGLAAALKSRGHVPVVLSGDPAATERLHGVRARPRITGLPRALASVDAVVSGGGGLLQDRTSARSLAYYLWVLRLARWSGRRVAVYGQSLGPLSDGGKAKLARELRGVPLFVRDRASLALAAELGLEASLVGDAALLLGAGSKAPPANAGASSGPVVLVPRGGFEGYNDALTRLASALAEAGRRVAVMALHPIEDLPPARRLLAAAPAGEWLEPSTPAAALELLKSARYVVSARLHGCILAAVAGVGFAGLVYDPKVAGFLTQAGAPLFEEPVDDLDLLGVALAARPPDTAAIAALSGAARRGIDELVAALGAKPA
ncbi:MAG TPA: polysaccharide pyruvyl transferase CsaB [Trueperaceae bacterium]|nr:polysaccharide pyruvyl transferase CsaB [Trueperaceae bacterium]